MAAEHHCRFTAVLDLLLTHAILHLVGLDHERSTADAHGMDEKTLQLLGFMGYSPEVFGWYKTAGSVK
jgi:ssRNA-specific RNase YbeY (16S rRNA maturation enzyme)